MTILSGPEKLSRSIRISLKPLPEAFWSMRPWKTGRSEPFWDLVLRLKRTALITNVKKLVLISILVSILPQLYAQNSSYAVQDRELGLIYARHAWSAFESSRWSDFQSLTEKGLEYDGGNPDLLGFKGVQAMNASRYADAFQWFTKAWYGGLEPEVLSRTDIMGWLFEVGFRLEKDGELESYYFSGSEMVRDDPEILFYAARSLRRLGREDRALELAEEGLYRFQDQRFLILLCSWTGEDRYTGMLSEYIGRQGILLSRLLRRGRCAERRESPDGLSVYGTE